MEITINRHYHGPKYIIGRLYVNGTYVCDTLERPLTDKQHPGILPYRYRVVSYPSAKFRGIRPLVADVPNRSGILIHEGNTVKDTQGCILVGVNRRVGYVLDSKVCLKKLLGYLQPAWKSDEEVWLSYS